MLASVSELIGGKMICNISVQNAVAVIEMMAGGEVLFENEIYAPNIRFKVEREVSFVAKHVSTSSMADACVKVNAMTEAILQAVIECLDAKVSGLGLTVTAMEFAKPQDWKLTLGKPPRGESSWNAIDNVAVHI
jgi:hypothetical protein